MPNRIRIFISRCHQNHQTIRLASTVHSKNYVVVKQGTQSFEGTEDDVKFHSKEKDITNKRMQLNDIRPIVFDTLLPRDYKQTTLPTYVTYAYTTMLSSTFGTAASVLSTQALLTAIGVGAATSLPIAATLNWILKDGIGQLGGILFAASMNTRFDSDPKRLRFGADVALAASVCIEAGTAMFPFLFLPLASIANVGKNIAWLSASATRASIHQSFALEHNLADVTGKAGSQTISASIAGTVLGIALSPVLSHDPRQLLLGTIFLSGLQVTASLRALHCVQLRNLNIQRAWLCLAPTLVSFRSSSSNVLKNETLQQSTLCSLDWDKLQTPEEVSKRERLIHFGKWGGRNGHAYLVSPMIFATKNKNESGVLSMIQKSFSVPPRLSSSIHINPSIQGILSPKDLKKALQICKAFDDQHVIEVVQSKKEPVSYIVNVWFLKNATTTDILAGFLHAGLIARALSRFKISLHAESGFEQLIYNVRQSMHRENACSKFLYALEDKGWDSKHVFIEERKENRLELEVE